MRRIHRDLKFISHKQFSTILGNSVQKRTFCQNSEYVRRIYIRAQMNESITRDSIEIAHALQLVDSMLINNVPKNLVQIKNTIVFFRQSLLRPKYRRPIARS